MQGRPVCGAMKQCFEYRNTCSASEDPDTFCIKFDVASTPRSVACSNLVHPFSWRLPPAMAMHDDLPSAVLSKGRRPAPGPPRTSGHIASETLAEAWSMLSRPACDSYNLKRDRLPGAGSSVSVMAGDSHKLEVKSPPSRPAGRIDCGRSG